MRILLINPPRFNEIIGNNPSIIEEQRGYNPPLGILYIASYIQKHTHHRISIIDSQVENLDYQTLKLKIASEQADIVGITAMTMTLVDVIKTAKIVKEVDHDIITVLGGPHAHLYPNQTIEFDVVDFLVLGEGETVFKELVDAIESRSAIEKIPGVVFKSNGHVVNTGARRHINNLDDLPFPARRMVPFEKYSSLLFKGEMVTTVFTSRGCPFRCSFCDRPHLGKAFRARSAQNVVDELEDCVQLGIHEFLFYDDTFTVDKKRVIDICNQIIDRGLDIAWDIRARVDTVDEEILMHLKRAGCQGIHYGIEAGTEKVLKFLNKRITIDQTRNIFNLTRKYKIPILAYFMIGNPAETLEDIQQTFKVIKSLMPDYLHMTILTPFPGTQIYHDGLARGIITRDFWKEFAANPKADFIPPHWGEIFSKAELDDLLVQGYRSFYLNPKYILRRIKKVRSLREFTKQAAAGIKVFEMR